MRKMVAAFLLASVAVGPAAAADIGQIGVMPTPDPIAPVSPYSSILGLWGAGAWLQTDDGDFDRGFVWAFGGDARTYFEYAPGQALQLELAGVAEQCADDDCDNGGAHIIAGAHWIGRHDATPWGLFAALSHTEYQDTGEDGQHVIGGLEAAMISGNSTYFGQFGGHVRVGGEEDSWNAGIFGRAGVRHFVTPDSKFEASVALGGLGDFDEEPGIWAQWNLEYEAKHANSPLSGFIAYQGDYLSVDDFDAEDTLIRHAFKVGLRASLGAPTLQSLQAGAGLFQLPDLYVPFSYTDDL